MILSFIKKIFGTKKSAVMNACDNEKYLQDLFDRRYKWIKDIGATSENQYNEVREF